MLPLTLLAFSTLALADDVSVEGYLQGLPGHGAATGGALRLDNDGRAFLAAEGRVGRGGSLTCACVLPADDRWWSGRATAGLDLFGRSEGLDLTLGLFLGSAGSWDADRSHADPTAGLEVGLGLEVGRLSGRYRHADGFRGPMDGWLTENELRVGFDLTQKFELFGQFVRFNPGDEVPRGGYGVGAALTF